MVQLFLLVSKIASKHNFDGGYLRQFEGCLRPLVNVRMLDLQDAQIHSLMYESNS